MKKKNENLKIKIAMGVGITLVLVMVIVLILKGTGATNNINKNKEKVTSEYEAIGITRELTREEQEHIDAIVESMEYITLKYGTGAYNYEGYEYIDDISEYIYVIDNEDNSKMTVIRRYINDEYLYSESLE
jgi:hypothetical protein